MILVAERKQLLSAHVLLSKKSTKYDDEKILSIKDHALFQRLTVQFSASELSKGLSKVSASLQFSSHYLQVTTYPKSCGR